MCAKLLYTIGTYMYVHFSHPRHTPVAHSIGGIQTDCAHVTQQPHRRDRRSSWVEWMRSSLKYTVFPVSSTPCGALHSCRQLNNRCPASVFTIEKQGVFHSVRKSKSLYSSPPTLTVIRWRLQRNFENLKRRKLDVYQSAQFSKSAFFGMIHVWA